MYTGTVWASVCVHAPTVCVGMLLSSEVVTALTAIPANGQILAITLPVATKPSERLQFLPARHRTGLWRRWWWCWGWGGFRRKTSSHSPQYTAPHSTPLAHEWRSNWFFFTSVHFPTWPDTERGFWAHLPFLVYFISRRRLIEREGKKKGIFIRKRINAQSAPFGRYIRPIH